MTESYARHFNPTAIPQTESIPGTAQVPNSAGGYAWAVDDWERLRRFVVLGADGPTYYASARTLTRENAEAVLRCVAADTARTVETIATLSEAGRAPKNDPAIFALALAAACGPPGARALAFAALPRVCRIGTHLFHFMRDYEALRPAGAKGGRAATGRYSRSVRRALAAWYQRDAEEVAFQAVKYGARDGWAHRDVLALAHPTSPTPAHAATYNWIMRPDDPLSETAPVLLRHFAALRAATDWKTVAWLVREHKLPREAVERADTKWLNELGVWEVLLPHMPLEAMVRQLGVMTARGLVAPMSDAAAHIVTELGNAERIRRSRLHPIRILAALLQYKAGASRGAVKRGESLTWTPVPAVIDALDGAFYAAFGNVESSGKRLLLALDLSGSMHMGEIAGIPGLTPAVGAGALALVTAAREPTHLIVGFTAAVAPRAWVPTGIAAGNRGLLPGAYATCLSPLTLSPRQRLDDALAYVAAQPMGGTDCALPMLFALDQGLSIDAFCVLTDNETWAGAIHPAQALQMYRAKTGIAATLIVVAMTSAGFSIADPEDAGMFDVVGFDTATPQLISDFIARS